VHTKELVSIVTPSYNSKKHIKATIASVLKQSYTQFEMIIVDDCSSDGSAEYIRSILPDERFKLITLAENSGAAQARNKAIEFAQGRYIAFLDADDRWYSDKLEKQLAFMQDNQVALSFTAYEVIDQNNTVLGQRIPPNSLSYFDILKSNQIGCLTAMYDTHALGKRYMPNIAKRQDMGLWLNILKSGVIAKGIVATPLAQYRIGGTSVSSKKLSVLSFQWQIYRDIEKLSLIQSIYYFSIYAYRGVTRKV
jgi:glycosyltransferase involved in cell wall biosynthesis